MHCQYNESVHQCWRPYVADVFWAALRRWPKFACSLSWNLSAGSLSGVPFRRSCVGGQAVATELRCVELSSGKCDVLVSHFQTAVFSVGFDVNAIKHERSSRFKRFNIKRQRIQKQHLTPVLYGNNN